MNYVDQLTIESQKLLNEKANTIFIKVDEGIYQIDKDRCDTFSGRSYASTKEVIDELNTQVNVIILAKNQLGFLTILHKN